MDTNKPSAGIDQGYVRPVPGLRQCRSAPAKKINLVWMGRVLHLRQIFSVALFSIPFRSFGTK
jgi:hypothetical protein